MKRKVITILTMLAITMTALSGCGKEEVNSGSSDHSTVVGVSDSVEESENKLDDPIDFSDTFDLDLSSDFGVDGFVIPILNNTKYEDLSFDGAPRYDWYKTEGHGTGETRYIISIRCNEITSMETVDNTYRQYNTIYSDYACGRNDEFVWGWAHPDDPYSTYSDCGDSGRCFSDGTTTCDGRNYHFFAVNLSTNQSVFITLEFVKETNLYGETCVSKDGEEYVNKIKEAFESLTL